MRTIREGLLWLAGCLVLAAPVLAQEDEDCLNCHGVEGISIQRDGKSRSIYVDADMLAASVHGSLSCVLCHTDLDGVTEFPHAKELAPVSCTDCHDDENGPIAAYQGSIHGHLVASGDERAPRCQDCHGGHDVKHPADPDSRVAHANVAATCVKCHVEGQPVSRDLVPTGPLTSDQVRERYEDRIHAKGLYDKGLLVAATCTNCHGGHAVLPPDDPASRISKDEVNETCKQCHNDVQGIHRGIVTPEAWKTAAPLCVDCHAPHEDRKVYYDQGISDRDCLSCHGEKDIVASSDGHSLFVDVAAEKSSVHGRHAVSCAQCHSGVMPGADHRPCAAITQPMQCANCHAGVEHEYEGGIHGRLAAKGDPNVPTCVECHGTHGILEHELQPGMPAELVAAIRHSPTFVRNVPELCARCHREGAPAAQRYTGPETKIYQRYEMSIHGKGLVEAGLVVTAVCTDCHTAHRPLPASDPDSTVNPDNVASTCGRCHDGIQEKFERSIHSPVRNPDYVAGPGKPPLPRCNDCHTAHTQERVERADFKLGIIGRCGSCHTKIAETYKETYHGKASALGDTTKAKCYDCHGSHEILPPSDPQSTLSKANIVETCAKCHSDAHPRFTGYLTHATHDDPKRYPVLYWAFWGMTSLLISVFVFFGLHTLLWFPRSWKERKHLKALHAAHPGQAGGEKQFMRFSRFNRGLHFTMILSFFGLAITGMMLKFSYSSWAHALSHVMGGPIVAGWIHRTCAVVTFTYMGLHLWDVFRRFRKSGRTIRSFFFGPTTILPTWNDAKEFFATIRWFLRGGPRPRYGTWTYWEKFDYFAVFWGVMIIGLTGLVLWFPEEFTRVLPGWTINVATIIHSDEALLAVGFIFTVHFFNTHFRPEKFPIDPVMFTGRMDVEELKVERRRLYEELEARGELAEHLVDPAPRGWILVVRVFSIAALTVGVTLVILIVTSMIGRVF